MGIDRSRARGLTIAALLVAGAVALAFHGPIPQDPRYHRFADTRTFRGVPNAENVLSNAALVAAGAIGFAYLARRRSRRSFSSAAARAAYVVFFAGVLLAGFGSAYYHAAPDNGRLFWDRLPMTLAFTSLFIAVIAERASARWAARLFVPLLGLGALSVLHWRWTQAAGRGDLRLYVLVQYGFAIAVGLVLVLFPAPESPSDAWGFAWVGAAYVLAKAAEAQDESIFRMTRVVSGHTLKHILAGVAAGLVLVMLARRRPVAKEVS